VLGANATKTRPNSNYQHNLTGTDTIYLTDVVAPSSRAVGETIAVIPIQAQAGRSLSDATERWQNVKYNHLEVISDGQGGAVTEGQYVVSFVADGYESNQESGLQAVQFARAQHCNQSANYRGKMSLKIPGSSLLGTTSGWYKSEENPEAPRGSSPGSIVVTNIKTPSTSVGLELQLRWNIDVRDRTSGRSRAQQIAVAQRAFGVSAAAAPDTEYAEGLVYDGTTALKPEDFVPNLQPRTYYSIPGDQLTMVGNTGASGSPQAALITHIGSEDGTAVEFYRYNPSTSKFDRITKEVFTAKPALTAAPIWEASSRFPADPRSPAFALGF